MLYNKPSNVAGFTFLENAVIVKTKSRWEKRGSDPGLKENIEEGWRQLEINTSQFKLEGHSVERIPPPRNV